MRRANTACFTGYRAAKLPWGNMEASVEAKLLRLDLLANIRAASANGITHFIVGMSDGTDLMAAEMALGLRGELGLTLECAVPFRQQAAYYTNSDKRRYTRILECADKKTLLSDGYATGCYELRNKYMVDQSSLVIAVFDGVAGGSRSTVEYAKKSNVETIILSPLRTEEVIDHGAYSGAEYKENVYPQTAL